MKNKLKDINYCDVNEEKIKNAKPRINKENLKYFYDWLTERYKIHLKKDINKLPKPWTDDKILQKYKFCNVRREHDKESRWLIHHIIESTLSYENKLLNIILFRLINKSQTIGIFDLIDFNSINFEEISQKLNQFKKLNPNYTYFSNAFFMSGPKTTANKLFPEEKNMIVKIILLVEKYKNQKIVEKIKQSKIQKEVFNELLSMPGIGTFLSYQIFVDFTYINEFPFSENEFVIAGPGCIRGLNLLFEYFDNLDYEEALFWLRDNQEDILSQFNYNPKELFSDLPMGDRILNIMSLENCMCEFSKYFRTLKGQGRPRIRYRGL